MSSSVTPDGGGFRVTGTLALVGVERRVDFRIRKEGSTFVSDIRLLQTDFRIKPYSAMLGTLKIKPEVEVRVEVPESALDS